MANTSPTMTVQDWDALARLARDPGADIGADCLAVLRRKHFVSKKGFQLTGYGKTRLAKHQAEEGMPGRPTPALRKAVKSEGASTAGLAIATTKGYGTRKTGDEWAIVDRFGQVIHGSGTFNTDAAAQRKADEMNRGVNQEVLAS